MSAIFIDSTNPKLWLMRTSQEPGVEEFVASVTEAMAHNPDKAKFGLLIDMRRSRGMSASSSARRQATAFIKEHQDWFADAMVCVARVAPDPIIRGVLTVYDFVTPGSWERKTFVKGAAAEAWARSKLADAGVGCPDETVWVE